MSPGIDGRRHRWVALPVNFAFDNLGTRLMEEFGYTGLAVWATLYAAAKRNPIEGHLSYGTEADGWAQLGLPPSPDFTLAEFFRVTGVMKRTRKRSRGGITYIEITGWEELQKRTKRQHEAEQKSRTREENSRTKDGPTRPDHDHDSDTYPDQTGDDASVIGGGEAIAIEEARREQAAGVLVNGKPIRDPIRLGRYRYGNDHEPFDHKHRQRQMAEAAMACDLCDSAGWVLGDDGTPIEPMIRCRHGADAPTTEDSEALERQKREAIERLEEAWSAT